MDKNSNAGESVYDLTINQLGTVLYHIANTTRVSLEYTGEFKRDVLNRVSSLLCNAIGFNDEPMSIEQIIQATWADLNEALNGETYASVDDYIHDRPLTMDDAEKMWDDSVRQCVSDPSVTCHCSLSEQLQCEWTSDPWDQDNSLYERYSQKV